MGNPVQELLGEFDRVFQETFGKPAPLVRGKDHKLAKDLLARYTLEDLKAWVREFFVIEDAWIERSGYTFGVFASCIGKLITAHAKAKRPTKADEYMKRKVAELDAEFGNKRTQH